MNARRSPALALFLLLGAPAAFAGGPLAVVTSGQGVAWPDGGRNITYRTDLGTLGSKTNAEAVAETAIAFGQWESIPTATATFVHAGSLPVDVDVTNFGAYIDGPPDDVHPIIFDSDGAIVELLMGHSSAVLGFASIDWDTRTGAILDGYVVMNGVAVDMGLLEGILVHEIGHMVGLDHSKVNGDLAMGFFGDYTGPAPYDTFARPASWDGMIETMYPFAIQGVAGGEETPHRDDVAIFSTLYPETTFSATTGSITGRVLGVDGARPVNGVNVIARNIADPFHDAVSSISGTFAANLRDAADPLAGVFRLNGLTPGAQYAVFIDALGPGSYRWGGVLPGPEEFYNGALESNDSSRDLAGEYAPITAIAGAPVAGIDIIFNSLSPGPIPLDMFFGRSWVELLLPFPVEIGGRTYRTVFLNAFDGTLTFGEPGAFPFEWGKKTSTLLNGPPGVVALMHPIGLFFGGTLAFDQTATTLTVHWTNVPTVLPDFSPGGLNTFSITLQAKTPRRGNVGSVTYGAIDVPSALAGFTSGSMFTTGFEPESDLSAVSRTLFADGRAAIYEEFVDHDFDLAGGSIAFELPSNFVDAFEPNDSPASARFVKLPFNTARDYAAVGPGDVDFYRFRAKAGDVLLAETVPGGFLDTLIALFGPSGDLLAVNDNMRPSTLLSRLIFTIPSDGDFTLAVTTGAIEVAGRYVLTLNTYRGRPLPLNGDDLTVEVPLRFRFPFQGQSWQSVWVSSNGNVTLGAPEAVTVIADMQLPGFLAGPPRIAPMFTDLDPFGTYTGRVGGIVLADEQEETLSIHWISVPMIFDRTTNTFSVTLTSAGDIKMSHGAIAAQDRDIRGTIVGVSAGNGTADPGPTDLSRTAGLTATGTTYEQFATSFLYVNDEPVDASTIPSFDLSFGEVKFSTQR